MRHAPIPSRPGRADWSQKALERTWRSVGALCFTIGIVNAFIPLLPTTVFLLIGVWAYGKGDPAMRERLLNHPRYGQPLRLWLDRRQISRKGKVAAVIGIALSATFTAVLIRSKPLAWAVVAGLSLLSLWLATRTEPPTAT